MNALAIRKTCSTEAYPAVRSFFEDFDSPVCYLPDNPPPYRILSVSDEVAFPGEGIYGWQYTIAYTDSMRLKTQRLCDKWTRLKPELDQLWNDPFEKAAAYRNLADRAHAFCMVYLAYGYLLGWKNGTPEALLEGTSLRDLYLEAEDIQERFFAGPDEVPGGTFVDRTSYTSALHYIYTDGHIRTVPGESRQVVDLQRHLGVRTKRRVLYPVECGHAGDHAGRRSATNGKLESQAGIRPGGMPHDHRRRRHRA